MLILKVSVPTLRPAILLRSSRSWRFRLPGIFPELALNLPSRIAALLCIPYRIHYE